MLDELEAQIENYFEHLEFICQSYTFQAELVLDVLTKLFSDFSGKVKSFHSLYPEKKIKDTPSDQLLAFISSINSFLTKTNSNFIKKLLLALECLETNLFGLFTNYKIQKELLSNLESLILPEFDFNFTRFFYSQIISRWIDIEDSYFDVFLTDIQKINEVLPTFKRLLSQDLVNSIRIGKVKDVSSTINDLADQLEKQILIIPVSLTERFKDVLIDYLTLIHSYSDVIILQFDLETLYTELLNKDLLFSPEFSKACVNQIEIIRSIKKKIDQNSDFFTKYNIDESVYNTKVKQLEQMIYAHNNILDHLQKSTDNKTLSIDILIDEELDLVELLKNNTSFFVSEIKSIFTSYIETILYLIEWWHTTKKSLLQQSQLYQLMFENFPQNDKILLIKEIKVKYFKHLFTTRKRFFTFIEEVTNDLLPIFDHFTVIHKSIFNALEDFQRWGSLEQTDPTKSAKAIIEAIIQFFYRWNAINLKNSFEAKLNSYNKDFLGFYNEFCTIYENYTKLKELRFSKPDKAIQKIELILNSLENSQENIYRLFSTNLEIIEHVEKLKNDIVTIKVLILYYDKLDSELLKNLSGTWDSINFQPYMKIMKEHLDEFPASMHSKSNPEKLKVLTLYNFLVNLLKIENYLNDSIFGTINEIDQFSEITKTLTQSKSILSNLKSLLPENQKDSIGYFNRNLEQFFTTIAPNWIKIAKKIKIFVENQSKKIILSDRKTLLSQLSEYTGTTINFSFKWPIFENHFKNFDKNFFPVFKKYFVDLMLLEDHWFQNITTIGASKNLDSAKAFLTKETEKFISNSNLEELSDQFFQNVTKLLEKRLELIKYSPNDSINVEKMKQLNL